MDKLFTGYYDDNGVGIYFGDALRNADGVDVVVGDDEGEPTGFMVPPPDDGYSPFIPYDLREGKGWVVIETAELEGD